jgi:iron complex outermembrane receptor protein
MNKNMMLKQSVIAVGMALASVHWAQAQQAPAAAAAPLQKVTVTGSNIKRVDIEGSSPVTIISSKEIKATGANTVAELLSSIPSMGAGGTFDGTDGGFARGTSTASLRGLGPSSTLVLLNGRRITASAYADPNQGNSTLYDLNTIPISALDRIEVLRDGASAVYGSDAIAGVINFITKKDYQGGEFSASASGNDDGKFARRNVSGIFGFGDIAKDRYNGFISFDLAQRDRTAIKDVKDIHAAQYADVNARLNEFSSSLTDQAFFYRERTPGAKNFANSFALRADVINRTNCDPSKQLVGDRTKHNLSATDTLIGRTFCNFNLNDYAEAQSEGKDANLLSVFTYQLSSTTTAFADFMYSRSDRTYTVAPRAFRSTASTTVFNLNAPPSQFQVILPVGHPDNPFPTSRAAVGYRFLNTQAGNSNLNEAYRLVAGLKGTVAGWDWETGLLWNRTERTEHTNGFLYKPTIEKIMTENRTLAQTAADPTATRNLVNTGFAQVSQVDAKASTEIGQLGGGAIGIVFGGELRQEKIGLNPDAATAKGDIVGLANSLADGSRNVRSAYVEMSTPFTKSLAMDFALRYDKYPSFKGSTVPKVGLKWAPSERFAFRSTYAEGFRAPALTQVSPGGVQSFSTVTDSIRCPDGVNPVPGADKVDCSKGISSLSSANPNLKPEISKSLTLGFLLSPTKDVDVVVDFFKIKKVAETALLSSQFVIDHQDQFPGLVLRDTNIANQIVDANGRVIPNSGPISAVNRTYVNQGSTEVSGVDFELAFRNSLGAMGKLSSRFQLGYMFTYRRAENPGDTTANTAGASGGISDWATTGEDIPNLRMNLATTWTMGPHALTGTVKYTDRISLLRRTDNNVTYPVAYCQYGTGQPKDAYQLGGLSKFSNWTSNCEVGSWTTFDVNYAYTGFKNMTLSFNIQNLFDTPAPYDPRSSYVDQGFNDGLHNGKGRYFRVGLSYNFK